MTDSGRSNRTTLSSLRIRAICALLVATIVIPPSYLSAAPQKKIPATEYDFAAERFSKTVRDRFVSEKNQSLHQSILFAPENATTIPKEKFLSAADRTNLDLFREGMEYAHGIFRELFIDTAMHSKGLSDAKILELTLERFYVEVDNDNVVYRDNKKGIVETTRIAGQLAIRVRRFISGMDGKPLMDPKTKKYLYDEVVFLGTDVEADPAQKFVQRMRLMKGGITAYQMQALKELKKIRFDKPDAINEWARTYWRALYTKPTKNHRRWAFAFGSLQTILVVGFGFLAMYVGVADGPPAQEMKNIALMAGLSFSLGTHRGKYISSYKAWETEIGSNYSKVIKRMAFSYFAKNIYLFLFYAFISPTGISGYFTSETQWRIITNSIFSGATRNSWYVFPEIYEKVGNGRQKLVVKGRDLGITRAQLYFQLIYLIPFVLSKADLMFNGTVMLPFNIPGLGAEFRISRIALVVGMGLAWLIEKWHVKRKLKKAREKAARTNNELDIAYKIKLERYLAERKARSFRLIKALIKKIKEFSSRATSLCPYGSGRHYIP